MRITKTLTLAVFCFFFLLSFAGNVFAAPQTTCPVMGGDINKDIYADYKGKRVYFCCGACPSQFTKDPEKYLAKLKEMGQEAEEIEQSDKDKDVNKEIEKQKHSEKEETEKEETDKDEHKDDDHKK